MINLKDAKYVSAVAEYKTIRAAAEHLYISSPALSMYIKRIEGEIGSALFIRENRLFVPTELGRLYISYAERILGLNEQFTQDLNLYKRQRERQLTIGLYRRRAINFLAPLISKLQSSLHDWKFDFRVGSMKELETMLQNKEVDYILVTHSIKKFSLKYSYVCEDEVLMVCPESYSEHLHWEEGNPYPCLPLSYVQDQTLLMPGAEQSIYAYVSRFLSDTDVQFKSVKTAGNMDISVQCAAAHIGICFTLASYIPSFTGISGVIFCRPVPEGIPVKWSLACLPDTPSAADMNILKSAISEQTRSFLDDYTAP